MIERAHLPPHYDGGSIVNLMSSLRARFGDPSSAYPTLADLPAQRLAAARHIVLLVIDGLGDELLARIGSASTLLAHREQRMTSVFPPTTASAVTTFMTGVAPQQHGLTGWFMYLRELGSVSAVLPFVPRWGGAPYSSAGVSPAAIIDTPGIYARLRAPCHVVLPAYIADSDFSRHLCGPAVRHGCGSPAELFDRVTQILRAAAVPTFVYAYWSELDRLAHQHGPSAPEVAGHLRTVDAAFATFLEDLRGSGTLVLATADHGFVDTPPERCIDIGAHPQLADMLLLPLCGEPRTAYCYLRPGCASAFERTVTDVLGERLECVPSANLLAHGWFGQGPAHPELGTRIGEYTLLLREDWVIRDCVAGERPFRLAGVHGGTSTAEMYVPLCVAMP